MLTSRARFFFDSFYCFGFNAVEPFPPRVARIIPDPVIDLHAENARPKF
jgi:hypothetical protein